MTTFIPGEVVNITIKGARVEPGEDVGLMPVSVGNWRTTINLRNAGVTVERVAPDETAEERAQADVLAAEERALEWAQGEPA